MGVMAKKALPIVSDVFTVADDILRRAKARGMKLTPLQLMKLTYISHGFALAALKKDLFGERIEAWKYGPVIPDLYHATKSYGRNPIPSELISDEGPTLVGDVGQLLDQVVDKYGGLSAFALSSLTHMAGSPWSQVFKENERGVEIPDEIIKAHYEKKLHAAKHSTAA